MGPDVEGNVADTNVMTVITRLSERCRLVLMSLLLPHLRRGANTCLLGITPFHASDDPGGHGL